MNPDRSRRTTGEAHPIDVFVGARIKQRRTEIGMSQEALGRHVNLTFQQVQKYERASNRVGASRLFEVAKALGVEIDYFFRGMPEDVESNASYSETLRYQCLEDDVTCREGPILSRSETLRLIANYYRIQPGGRRRAIYELLKGLAEAENGQAKEPTQSE